ncbi:MAG: phosphodiester glycosidase family protein [Oscillospiraceae bacterium]|nr:phosphodiester glycosidase family protein [Oscillospiraceae bacterium]
MFRKKYTWAVCYGLLLTAFTVYAALDTFVIRRAYTVVEDSAAQAVPTAVISETNAPQETTEEPVSTEPVITENSYSDENITITITEYREYDTSIYVADVVVSSAEYLKTAFAENTYGRNVTAKTSEIADSVGAILAINGDYYGSQESGYVLRNGVLYRSLAAHSQEDLVIYADGSFEIISESDVTAEILLAQGAEQILSFGPALVENGAVAVTSEDEVGKAKTSNPRTAIGIIDNLHYLLVVSDGRTDESAGLTLYELAEFMQSLGSKTAYNLDGGGSSTMVFNGVVVNNPTSSGRSIKERSVSDIVYIGY